jgi:hypothetical protein
MGETPSDFNALDAEPPDEYAPERPRFPYTVAAFALACVICAVWLWMKYSYAWDMADADTGSFRRGAYVRCPAKPAPSLAVNEGSGWTFHPDGETISARVVRIQMFMGTGLSGSSTSYVPVLDPTASRLHPASVAGLVVAAMGLGVFALHLRKWLAERRAFLERTRPVA